jgi:hypothetical protein
MFYRMSVSAAVPRQGPAVHRPQWSAFVIYNGSVSVLVCRLDFKSSDRG